MSKAGVRHRTRPARTPPGAAPRSAGFRRTGGGGNLRRVRACALRRCHDPLRSCLPATSLKVAQRVARIRRTPPSARCARRAVLHATPAPRSRKRAPSLPWPSSLPLASLDGRQRSARAVRREPCARGPARAPAPRARAVHPVVLALAPPPPGLATSGCSAYAAATARSRSCARSTRCSRSSCARRNCSPTSAGMDTPCVSPRTCASSTVSIARQRMQAARRLPRLYSQHIPTLCPAEPPGRLTAAVPHRHPAIPSSTMPRKQPVGSLSPLIRRTAAPAAPRAIADALGHLLVVCVFADLAYDRRDA